MNITALKCGFDNRTQIKKPFMYKDVMTCPCCQEKFYTIDLQKDQNRKKPKLKDCFDHLCLNKVE